MRTSTLLAAAASLSSVTLAENAPITQNNPIMTDIQATLQTNKDIQGSITGVSENGTGVNFNINFYDFPSTGGPFSYYIANAAVPSSNACTSLTTLFNPYSASTSACKTDSPSACPLGALSAKHGGVTGETADSSFQKFYLDLYLSTSPGSEAYFGGRAIVVADENGTPVNCATFSGTASGSGGVGPSSSSASSIASASSSMASMTSSMSSASSSSAASASSASAAATSSAAAVANQAVAGSGMALVAAIAALVF